MLLVRVLPGMSNVPPYHNLTPDCVLDAAETSGCHCGGRVQALIRFENRVYQGSWRDHIHTPNDQAAPPDEPPLEPAA